MHPLSLSLTELGYREEDERQLCSTLLTPEVKYLEKLDPGTPKVLDSRRCAEVVFSNLLAYKANKRPFFK